MELKSEFPHAANRKVFKNTFLKEVQAAVSFDGNAWTGEECFSSLKAFAKRQFGLEDIGETFLNEKGIAFVSEELATSFFFSPATAGYKIGGKGYVSFSTTQEGLLNKLTDYLNSVPKTDKVKWLKLRKLNVWPVTLDKEDANIIEPLKYLFKEHYAKILEPGDDEKDLVKKSKQVANKLCEGCVLLIDIQYRYIDKSKLEFSLSVETFYKPNDGISLNDVLADARQLNSVMYDAYMDAVTDEVVRLMDVEG